MKQLPRDRAVWEAVSSGDVRYHVSQGREETVCRSRGHGRSCQRQAMHSRGHWRVKALDRPGRHKRLMSQAA